MFINSPDIDECTAVHDCNANATCANIEGSFTCACNEVYTGDKVKCSGKCSLFFYVIVLQ